MVTAGSGEDMKSWMKRRDGDGWRRRGHEILGRWQQASAIIWSSHGAVVAAGIGEYMKSWDGGRQQRANGVSDSDRQQRGRVCV